MTKTTSVERDEDEGFCDAGTVLFVAGAIILGVLLGIAFGPMVHAQEEMGLEDVPQKELEGLPVKDGGVLAQTWDWFISLLGYEVEDVDVIKRSIVEQDLDIDDVRLVTENDTEERIIQSVGWVTNTNAQCEWIASNSSWRPCYTVSKVTAEWTETVVTGTYQVFVTPTQTYDVPDKTTCYDNGNEYVCESTLRCDGLLGIEYGCEHVIVKKEPEQDGTITTLTARKPPMRDFVTRKEVMTSPELIIDSGMTKRIPQGVIDAVKANIIVEEVAVE